jgi:hypothetical protein
LQIGNFKYQVCGDLLGRSGEHPQVEGYKNIAPAEGPAGDEKGTNEEEAV